MFPVGDGGCHLFVAVGCRPLQVAVAGFRDYLRWALSEPTSAESHLYFGPVAYRPTAIKPNAHARMTSHGLKQPFES